MTLPLASVRILDLSTVLSGPIAAAMLCDQGASVIKVESHEGDTSRMIGPAKGDLSAMFIASNRGKRSIALDLKAPAAQAVLQALVKQSDVLINNFRPGVMDRLGLSDAALKSLNPRLIHLSITGFGATGPASADKAYDAVIQAVGGVCASQRDPQTGNPMVLSTAVCDKLTALTAAQAVSAALFARERDGQGRKIEIAMLDATLMFQWPDAMYNHVFLDEPPTPFPEFGASQKPWKTADGFVASMAPQQAEFSGQCRALNRSEVIDDPRFKTLPMRGRNAKVLRETLEPSMAQFTTAELVSAMRREGAPMGRVNERAEVIQDPQVVHNQSCVEIDHGSVGRVRLARSAPRFDGQALPAPKPAPHLGEHGGEILRELGWSEAQLVELQQSGVLKL